MLPIDLRGKRAFVAGVSDDGGFGFAIAKALAEAGATVCLGSWPPALGIFQKLLERGKMDASMTLADGRRLEFERIYPLDAAFDTMADVPADIGENKRYKEQGDFTVQGVVERIRQDFGERPLDIVVHSLANGPEVKNALLDTSRAGYLSAVSVSAYSNVSFVRNFGPLMREGGSFLSLTLHGGGAGHSGLRRRHVHRQGGARGRHPHAGLRSGPPVRRPDQHHLGGALRLARRVGDRLHRHDDRVLVEERAADPEDGGA